MEHCLVQLVSDQFFGVREKLLTCWSDGYSLFSIFSTCSHYSPYTILQKAFSPGKDHVNAVEKLSKKIVGTRSPWTVSYPLIMKRGFQPWKNLQLLKMEITPWERLLISMLLMGTYGVEEIAANTGTNATKFLTLVTKSWKLVAKLATRMFHHNLTKRYSELKRFAKINPRQTSSLSLFPKCSTCISIDN